MKTVWILAAVLILVAPAPSLDAEGLAGGIAVAVSADGKQLVAGGRNRALYEIDPASLEVKRRAYLGRQIQKMAFSPSGKTLIVESTKVVQWLSAETFAVRKTLENAGRITMVPAAGLLAVNSKARPYSIKLLDIETGEEKASVPYDKMKSVAAFALQPDGKQVAILYGRRRDESEKKVAYKEIPKDLKGPALNVFKQKNDGYTASFAIFDVATGQPVLEKTLWYGAPGGGNIAFWNGDKVFVVGYENQNATIDAKGEVAYFELANSYNYARSCDATGAALLTGGLRRGARTTLPDRKAVAFELDKIEGFPEYFKSFDFAADGTGYAGTTASRVVRIGADGVVQASKPIY